MPTSLPVPTKNPGDVFTSSTWNSYVRDNINKLLNRGHRVLTVAQFAALTGLEGTKGTVAPDEVYVEVDATNGIQWHFAYESGEVTYKWRFLGGPALFSEVTTAESNSSTTYAALATAGPSVALPRSGDYDVTLASRPGTQFGSQNIFHSYDIGATAAADADAVWGGTTSGDAWGPHMTRRRRKTGLGSVTLTSKYRSAVANAITWENRSMSVKPVRVRHDA